MRWILIMGVIAMSSGVLSHPTRRNWPHVRNVIAKGLFGRNTAIIIQQPEIPEHKNYQLFKIDGYENIVINLTRREDFKNKKLVEQNVQTTDFTSKSEIDIIANYLGTNRDETLLALEALQSLLKSGILNANQDVENPNTPELKPVQVYVEESAPSIDVRFASEEKNKSNIEEVKNQNNAKCDNKDKCHNEAKGHNEGKSQSEENSLGNLQNVELNDESSAQVSKNNNPNTEHYVPNKYVFEPPKPANNSNRSHSRKSNKKTTKSKSHKNKQTKVSEHSV